MLKGRHIHYREVSRVENLLSDARSHERNRSAKVVIFPHPCKNFWKKVRKKCGFSNQTLHYFFFPAP